MTRFLTRPGLALGLGLLAASSLGPDALAGGKQASQPDILVVLWDTTRPDHLSPYGYERDTTPFLDDLMADGHRFDNVIAGGPWTLPSMASMFTGLYVHNHGVSSGIANESPMAIPPDRTTFAELLSGAGYRTVLVAGQWLHLKHGGFDRGWDIIHKGGMADPNTGHARMDDLTIQEIKAAPSDEPLLMMVHTLDPHSPYQPHPTHDLWRDDALSEVYIGTKDNGQFDNFIVVNEANQGTRTISDDEMQFLVNAYDGELHQNDARLRKIWETWKAERGDDAIVIVTADHGEAFGEHGDNVIFHERPYDVILRIPLLMRGPGIPNGSTDLTVSNIDILPTLADLAGVQAPEVNGRSLVPVMSGEDTEPSVVAGFSQWAQAPAFFRTDDVKWIDYRVGASNVLYLLGKDPGESDNLASTMETLFQNVQASFEKFLEDHAIEAAPVESKTLNDDELQALRALGYVE